MIPRNFTEEQDVLLMKLAERHGPGCWNEIAYQMGTGHQGPQIRHRYKYLSARSNRGLGAVWSPEENKRLKMAVKMLGEPENIDWTVVAQLIPNRSNTSCRERYEKISQESLGYDQDPWTEEESELLKALVAELGPRWSLISQRFTRRSDNFLMRRWNEIGDADEVRKFKQDRVAMKAIMRGGLNPDERPEISPSDFQLLHDANEEPSDTRPRKRARRQPRGKKKPGGDSVGDSVGDSGGGEGVVADECIFGAVASIEAALSIISANNSNTNSKPS